MDIDVNLSDIKDSSPFGQPPSGKNKNRRFNLSVKFIVVLVLSLGILIFAGYFSGLFQKPGHAIYLVKRIIQGKGVNFIPTVLDEVTISVEEMEYQRRDGETIDIHPDKSFFIKEFKTDGWRSSKVKILCNELGELDFLKKRIILSEIQAKRSFFVPRIYTFRVMWDENEIGGFKVKTHYLVDDFTSFARGAATPEEKIKYYRLALSIEQDNETIMSGLAEALSSAGKIKGAISVYSKLITNKPKKEYIKPLVNLYISDKRYKDAVRYQELLVKVTGDLGEQEILARLYEKKGDFKKALSEYKNIASKQGDDVSASICKKIAFLYVKTKSLKQAAVYYEKALKKDPSDINLHYNLAEIYGALDKKDVMAMHLTKIVKASSGDINALMKLVDYLEADKQYFKVIEFLKPMLKKRPKDQNLRIKYINSLEKTGQTSKAIEQYQLLLKAYPKNKIAWFNLGVLLKDKKRYKESINAFIRVLKLNTRDINARKHLIDIYQKQKDAGAAATHALRILDISPMEKPFYQMVFEYYKSRDKHQKIIDLMNRGIKNYPDEKDFYIYRGYANIKLKNYKAAIFDFEKAAKLSPKDVQVMEQIAGLLEKTGQYQKAMETYKQLITIRPGNELYKEKYLQLKIETIK